MIEHFTIQDIVKDIAERWKYVYCTQVKGKSGHYSNSWETLCTMSADGRRVRRKESSYDIYKRLVDLGDNPDPKEVMRIVYGYTGGWVNATSKCCSECCDMITEGIRHNERVWCYECFDKTFPELVEETKNNIWE